MLGVEDSPESNLENDSPDERNLNYGKTRKWYRYLCLTSNLTIGFSILCIVVFLASYVPVTLNNQSYVIGTCTIVKGRVIKTDCRFSPLTPFSSCYNAYFGISAIKNIVEYLFVDSYSNETEAIIASNRDIGKIVNPCYYKNAGKTITLSLPSALGPYVAGFVFLSLAIVFTIITFLIVWIKFELRTKFYNYFLCCKCCLGKKQYYKPFADQPQPL